MASPPPLGLTRLRGGPPSLFLADYGNSDVYGSDNDDDGHEDVQDDDGGGDDDEGRDRTKKRVT